MEMSESEQEGGRREVLASPGLRGLQGARSPAPGRRGGERGRGQVGLGADR